MKEKGGAKKRGMELFLLPTEMHPHQFLKAYQQYSVDNKFSGGQVRVHAFLTLNSSCPSVTSHI